MRFAVRVRGRGKVQIPAYGVADAEHLVEKELHRLWPAGRVTVEEIGRAGPSRIVEEFQIAYRIEGSLHVVAPRREEAPAAAYRQLRGLLKDSRYRRTEWEEWKGESRG